MGRCIQTLELQRWRFAGNIRSYPDTDEFEAESMRTEENEVQRIYAKPVIFDCEGGISALAVVKVTLVEMRECRSKTGPVLLCFASILRFEGGQVRGELIETYQAIRHLRKRTLSSKEYPSHQHTYSK